MRCCVPGCRNYSRARHFVHFHRFPYGVPELCRLWLIAVRHPLPETDTPAPGPSHRDLRVCSDHFQPSDYHTGPRNQRLMTTVVPSIFPWSQGATGIIEAQDMSLSCKTEPKSTFTLGPDCSDRPVMLEDHSQAPNVMIKEEEEEKALSVMEREEDSFLIKEEEEPLAIKEEYEKEDEDASVVKEEEEEKAIRVLTDPNGNSSSASDGGVNPSAPEDPAQQQPPRDTHTPLYCPDCGKSFVSLCMLNAHRRIHTGERPYQCPECGKGFRCVGNRNKHRVVHTGERAHQCPQCGKSFLRRHHLKEHQRIHQRSHSGERQHQCARCGQGFTKARLLRIHLRLHDMEAADGGLGENGYMSMARQRALRVLAGGELHYCGDCGKSYSSASYLRVHQRTHCKKSVASST